MPSIKVVKSFTLTLSIMESRKFTIGEHDVSEEIADHWYTKAHCVGGSEAPVGAVEEPTEPVDATDESELTKVSRGAAEGITAHADAVANGEQARTAMNAMRRAAEAARKASKK